MLVVFGGAIVRATEATARLDRYGTPGYAAPEQYSDVAMPQSDVYGLAATLYHLLTDDPGAHPFMFPAMSKLSADLRAALAPALAQDPEARPTATSFLATLNSAGAGVMT